MALIDDIIKGTASRPPGYKPPSIPTIGQTTVQQPGGDTPKTGQVRVNPQTGASEIWNGTAWVSTGGGPADDGGTGSTGSTGTWSIKYDSAGNAYHYNSKTRETIPAPQLNRGVEDTGGDSYTPYITTEMRNGKEYTVARDRITGQELWATPTGETASGGGAPDTRTINGAAYIWDSAQGKYVPAPGIPANPLSTSSGGTSGLGSLFNSLAKSAGSSGGGGKDYAQELNLINARADAAIRQAVGSDASDIEKAKAVAQINAEADIQVALIKAQIEAQFAGPELALKQADQRRQQIADLTNVISMTDPAAMPAFLAAGGGNIENAIASGASAVSNNAMLPAALLLQQLAAGGAQGLPTGQPTGGGTGLPTGGGAGIPTPGAGLPTGGVPTGGTPTGGVPTGGTPTSGTPTGGVPAIPENEEPSGGSLFNNPNTAFGAPSQFPLQAMPGGFASQIGFTNGRAMASLPGGEWVPAEDLRSVARDEAAAEGIYDFVTDKFGRNVYDPEFGKGDPDIVNRITRGDYGPDMTWLGETMQPLVLQNNANTPYLLQAAGQPIGDFTDLPSNVGTGGIAPRAPSGTLPANIWDETTRSWSPNPAVSAPGYEAPPPAEWQVIPENPTPKVPLPSAQEIAAAGGHTAFAQANPDWTFIPGQGLTYKPPKTTSVPAFAKGGRTPKNEPYVAGDSPNGLPNPELIIPGKNGEGDIVIPFSKLKGFAYGTDNEEEESSRLNLFSPPPQTIAYGNDSVANPVPSAPAQPAPASTPAPTSSGSSSAPTVPTLSNPVLQTTTGANLSAGGQLQTSTPPPPPVPQVTPAPVAPPAPPPAAPPPAQGAGPLPTDVQANLPALYQNNNIPIPDWLQPYIQQVAGIRQNVQYPQLNPYDVAFGRQLPTIRDLFFGGRQSQFGIPLQDQLFEQARYQLPGASRSQIALGL